MALLPKQCEGRGGKEGASKTRLLRNTRSNSFDIAIIYKSKSDADESAPSNWFVKRHQPKDQEQKEGLSSKKPLEIPKVDSKPPKLDPKHSKVVSKEPGKVVWDGKSGSLVDVHALGSAIEVFLRKVTPEASSSSTSLSNSPNKKVKQKSSSGRSIAAWFTSRSDEESAESCESSLCSTLKDLFVK